LGPAAAGGLLGGLVMFFVMAGYNASAGMGFLTILDVCFAAWVSRGTAMPAGTMGESPMPAHTAMASPMPGHSAMVGAMPTESAMAGHAGVGGHGMGAAAMMNQPILVSHVIVGGVL